MNRQYQAVFLTASLRRRGSKDKEERRRCKGVLMHHAVWNQGLPLFRWWSVRPDVSRRDWCRCWQVQEQRL